MDFVYRPGQPSSRHEKQLIAEYPWVRTNSIEATRVGEEFGPRRPDRLGTHSHHGENTHMIVTGDLDMEIMGGTREGEHVRINADRGSGCEREGVVPPYVPYAATSKNGCSFVEGHRCLSPRSAERFIDRGTLCAVARDVTRCDLPDEETLKRYLRHVEFDPTGKARPSYWMWEKKILTPTEGCPPISDSAQLALSRWFENEWQGQASSLSPILILIFIGLLMGIAWQIFL
jgi:hypothetical protein